MDRSEIRSRKELEEELQASQEILLSLETYIQEFAVFLPLPVCSINLFGVIVDVNKAFQQLSEYTPAQIGGASIETVFLEQKEMAKLLEEVLQKKEIITREMILLTRQKRKIPVKVSILTRRDREGDVIGYFIAITDITELKKLQRELEEKVKERTEELQERINQLERFHRVTVGRELKMVELKEEIRRLKKAPNKAKK